MNSFSPVYLQFLEFEKEHFGDTFPVVAYDPYMIRYSEYRFVLDSLHLNPSDTLLDIGCGYNIFPLFTASMDTATIGLDSDPANWRHLERRLQIVENHLQKRMPLSFQVSDATRPPLADASVDKVSAVSSIEHMFSASGDGDRLAVHSIASVLKPGGIACVTLPMSNGNPFHEAPHGDENFPHAYRLYTPEALEDRILNHPEFELVKLAYIAHRTPDPRHADRDFFVWWMSALKPRERWKWAWLNPILAAVFNPIVSREEGEANLCTTNTALICLRKIGA